MVARQSTLIQTGRTGLLLTFFLLLSSSRVLLAEPDSGVTRTAVPAQALPEPAENSNVLNGPLIQEHPTWSEVVRAVLLTAIPHQYEDLKHWGKTNEVFDGVRVQQRGLNIRLTERKRKVKHGAWHKYKVEMIDPAQSLKLVIEQIRPQGLGRFQFDVRMASKLRCRADFEHWVLGIKGLNISTVSEADVEVVAHCDVVIRTELNRKSLLPDLIIEPTVQRVELFLRNLRVNRIGEIRGDIAKIIGETARHDLENLIQAQEGRVVQKANEAIEKKRRSLRLSASQIW